MVSPSTIRRTGTWTEMWECWGHWEEQSLHTPGGSSAQWEPIQGGESRWGSFNSGATASLGPWKDSRFITF